MLLRTFPWGVTRAIVAGPHVGEVVPGAEDPCYDAPEGLPRSFCLDQQRNPEKWAKWREEWKKRTRPHLQFPEQMIKDAQAQHAAELAAAELPWYDRPLVVRAHGGFTDDPLGKIGSEVTAKRAAIAVALGYLGVAVLT